MNPAPSRTRAQPAPTNDFAALAAPELSQRAPRRAILASSLLDRAPGSNTAGLARPAIPDLN